MTQVVVSHDLNRALRLAGRSGRLRACPGAEVEVVLHSGTEAVRVRDGGGIGERVAVVHAVREGVGVSHTGLVTGRIGSRNRGAGVVVVCVAGQLLGAVVDVSHVPA